MSKNEDYTSLSNRYNESENKMNLIVNEHKVI